MLARVLTKLESLLREEGRPVLSRMQEGLESEEISNMLLENEVYNDALVALYEWKNGNRPDLEDNVIEKLELFPEGIMLSIQEALAIYKLYSTAEQPWRTKFFPIFANGGGSYLLFDIHSNSETSGMILLYDPVPIDSKEIVSIYDSIERMFESIVKCIEKNAYEYRSDGTIDLDFEIRSEVCSKMNPESEYWK